MLRTRLALRYMLGEMIPPFILGVVAFLLILLMLQALRLIEFVLSQGVQVSALLEIVAYMSTSFLPVLFPMSLLLAVLLTYGRMSGDSEIVALRAAGLNTWHIITPAIVLALLVAVLSAQTSFNLAPWGNRQSELLLTKIGSARPAAQIKEGTFSEGFFDLVVYANKVDSKSGVLGQVFIYDERNPKMPATVIAREGRIIFDPEKGTRSATLDLIDGSIHNTNEGRHTKIDFTHYTINFEDAIAQEFKKKTPPSFTLDDLRTEIERKDLPDKEHLAFEIEYQKRWALPVACLLFALIGAGLGTSTNRRAARSGGSVIAVGLIVVYWVLSIGGESLAKNLIFPVVPAIWLANAVFTLAAFFALRRGWT